MAAEQPLDHKLILAAARDYVDKSNRGEVAAFWAHPHTHTLFIPIETDFEAILLGHTPLAFRQLTLGRLLNACLVL